MPRKAKSLMLAKDERHLLLQIDERGSDLRERWRARTLLLLDKGLSIDGVVTQQKIHRDAWLARSFSGLRDLPRSDAPRNPSETHKQVLCAWANAKACTALGLRSRLSEEHDVQVSVWLAQRALKEKGYVWKKTQYSLRKKLDEDKIRERQVKIAEFVEKAKPGEIALACVDEAGLAQAQPNRTAWTKTGEVHLHLIVAERGKRLNVLGALISAGALFTAKFRETTTADFFGGFLGPLLESVGRAPAAILDNALIHKPLLTLQKCEGLRLVFLLPYSPELNVKLYREVWPKMKYEWMAFKARSAATLEADVDKILNGFGSDYRMASF